MADQIKRLEHECDEISHEILRGIDRTFENWWKRPARARTEKVNSIAYCAQAIAAEAQAMVSVT